MDGVRMPAASAGGVVLRVVCLASALLPACAGCSPKKYPPPDWTLSERWEPANVDPANTDNDLVRVPR